MSVIAPPLPRQIRNEQLVGDQRVSIQEISWQDYVAIGDILRDRPGLRLTYDDGKLEIMTLSPEHDRHGRWLGDFLVILAEECNVRIAPFGSMTFKREDLAKGFEPDDCYWIGHERQMRGKLTWDPAVDPPPDLIQEIEMSRSAISRMPLFAAFRVPEVWRFDGESLRAFVLQSDDSYLQVERSPTFPKIPLQEIVRFLEPDETKDYLTILREFRAWVREQLKQP
ncbi:MAG TPA: Uma2 family endonuclease [Gemmataceae bacterium]|nr:Uma2 family endonuclease [Gemmataceae bacterium]